jgi:hypothetical protein
MTLNGSDRIDDTAGDYLVLYLDNRDHFGIDYQTDNLEDAIAHLAASENSELVVVKLVRVEVREVGG